MTKGWGEGYEWARGQRGEVRKTIMERCKSTVKGGGLHEIKQITVVKLRSPFHSDISGGHQCKKRREGTGGGAEMMTYWSFIQLLCIIVKIRTFAFNKCNKESCLMNRQGKTQH